ncbi:MAG TPA: sigma-54 dependent transcriptional regulator [Vicinamibacterales bacterium]|nr:sigma-54 dependent transcriptional regulator [Vicinamibacterales bacterium]
MSNPSQPLVLVADDEPSIRHLLSYRLRKEGYDVVLAENGKEAIAVLERGGVDLLVSDIRMPDMSGVDVLRAAKGLDPDILGVMITAYASKETSVEALRLGASNYVEKGAPEFPSEVVEVVGKAIEQRRIRQERRALQQENVLLKRTLAASHQFGNIIGRSDPMVAVFKLIETVAPTTSTILLTGESGTGKELVARAIHFNSPRRDRPFVALNCGALPETLLESELFGHVRGAFTGAAANKKGLIEVADRGTLFLDEIAEMTAMVQVKLLRVLQERRFRRLGGLEEVEADIRIIAATNQDLGQLVADGRFREDLFYRINVIPVHLPPLRERREDIPLLAEHFLRRFCEQMGKQLSGLSREAVRLLEGYHWPGNIRELENVLERAVALERSPVILPDTLSPVLRGLSPRLNPVVDLPDAGFNLESHVQDIERGYLAEALRRAGGVQSRAADILGMTFRSFRYYAKKYNLK